MSIVSRLKSIWEGCCDPFLIYNSKTLKFSDITSQVELNLSEVKTGDVVALIGDFDPKSIQTFLMLIDLGAVLVPLTKETSAEHEYFFETACVDVIIENDTVRRRFHSDSHHLIDKLVNMGHSGLILFSTGTTGRPKAILHDFSVFLQRFAVPRPTLRTINFLLFDHIGGINTLFHTLFNKGVVVAPQNRSVEAVLKTCREYEVEVLPTTPTFLRMMLMMDKLQELVSPSLKVITYGTERMDQPTLDELCRLLPDIDFRQTFGMSELGIMRVKSEAKNSLFMKIGGEGIETRVVDNVLQIKSRTRMMGYLNADSPFDEEGWYDTKDIVETKGQYYKVIGRLNDVINVGGLKFMPSEVERVCLEYPGVALVKAQSRTNPITGQHVEVSVQPKGGEALDKADFVNFLKTRLQPHMVPRRILVEDIQVGHRFKKA